MDLQLYNTLSRNKELFKPLNEENVTMYVCGPTVYDYAHIGNARPIIVFDMLFRVLRHKCGVDHVTYVRNITDVDDKINARARKEGVSIQDVTTRTIKQFHEDIAALGVLPPSVEPRATEHIEEMKTMIDQLIAKGHAYVAEDHVLFSVSSMDEYGKLSNRTVEEMEAGARVEVAAYKRDPMDFVLWKPSREGEPAWPSPGDIDKDGRPGWHIECSAMAKKHLGDVFDIHGGGVDLVFPHHENEIAQSRCTHGSDTMANIWMHNGFLQVEGEKMSKSIGNFITIHELLKDWPGEVLRFNMLKTNYRQPIDWTVKGLEEAQKVLRDFYKISQGHLPEEGTQNSAEEKVHPEILEALYDDLNTPWVRAILSKLKKNKEFGALAASLKFMGFSLDPAMLEMGAKPDAELSTKVEALITARLEARNGKDWAEADRIRDQLTEMGITIKDGKNPDTGEIVTTWDAK